MIPLRIPHLTFRMLDNSPPPPHFLLLVPLLLPVPGRLYEGLCRPLMFPHLQQEAAFPPPGISVVPSPLPLDCLPGADDVPRPADALPWIRYH
uniref:Doublesex and mab-3 related transcription factor like family A2 n=1 Tax=Nothobranchius pienaari TaxID=704102 RepID=A0A1A8LRL8_9TELE